MFEFESPYSLIESCLISLRSKRQALKRQFLQLQETSSFTLKSPISKFLSMNTNNDVKNIQGDLFFIEC